MGDAPSGIPNLGDQMMEGGEMAAAPFSDARTFCHQLSRDRKHRHLENVGCLCFREHVAFHDGISINE